MGLFRRNAFTLIELLIVVAIIAILAAIAVPNFLEAQVRSKVSRVRTDERSLAVALEAYCVDNQKYPPCMDMAAGVPIPQLNYQRALVPATTPIAFITKIPGDPFDAKNRKSGPWSGYAYKDKETTIRAYILNNGADPNNPTVYQSAEISQWGWWVLDCDDSSRRASLTHYGWALNSEGPDLWPNEIQSPPLMDSKPWCYPYDASNGTVSRGDIPRRGP